jgi:AcrR family transcriptional regulator
VLTTTEKGASTRRLIVAATAELMARSGVSATSLDAVRAATGTSKSQLYHYFDDKADLVRAVVRHQADVVVSAQHLADDAPCDEGSLLRWRYRVVAAQRARGFAAGCPLGSLAAELAGATWVDEATRRELADAFARWRSLLETGLREGMTSGELRNWADPATAAEVLVTAVEGGSLLSSVADAPGPLQAALERAVEPLLS